MSSSNTWCKSVAITASLMVYAALSGGVTAYIVANRITHEAESNMQAETLGQGPLARPGSPAGVQYPAGVDYLVCDKGTGRWVLYWASSPELAAKLPKNTPRIGPVDARTELGTSNVLPRPLPSPCTR